MFTTQFSTPATQSTSSQRTLSQFYPFVRLSQYIAKFKADPLALSNPHIMRDECEWVANGTGNILARKRHSLGEDVRPAELRIIGEISSESYWLTACGGWSGAFSEPLEKAKASGRLSVGRIPDIAALWPLFLDNLDTIVFSRGPPLNVRQYPLIERGSLKIRHKIFEPVSSNTCHGKRDSSGTSHGMTFDQAMSQALSVDIVDPMQMSFLLETPDSTNHVKVKEELDVKTETHDDVVPSGLKDSEDFVDIADEIDALESCLNHGASLSKASDIDESDVDSESTISESDDGDATTVVAASTIGQSADSNEDTSDDELPAPFDMRNWPCRNDHVRRELDGLIAAGKFIGKPLPVFDLDGKRVPPIDHEKRLKGALVDIAITITNVTYRQDSYFADIRSIVILAPPGYQPMVEKPKAKYVKAKYPVPRHLKEFNSIFTTEV